MTARARPQVHKVQFQRHQADPSRPAGHISLDFWEPTVADAVRQCAEREPVPLRPSWWTPLVVELEIPTQGKGPARQFQVWLWIQPKAHGPHDVVAQLSTIEMFT